MERARAGAGRGEKIEGEAPGVGCKDMYRIQKIHPPPTLAHSTTHLDRDFHPCTLKPRAVRGFCEPEAWSEVVNGGMECAPPSCSRPGI